jgi:hypothetical protein
VWLARIGLWVVPFRALQRVAERLARPRSGSIDPPPGEADRLGWAVASAARFVPWACGLTQALAAKTLLARRGHPAEVRLGVARDEHGRFLAHAWVESSGRIVVGEHERERFTPLSSR